MQRQPRAIATALAVLLAAALPPAARAQAPQGAQPGPWQQKLEARFAAADTNHDGRLSREEARAGMPGVAAHFDEIDAGKTGYVTLAQIEKAIMDHAAAKSGH